MRFKRKKKKVITWRDSLTKKELRHLGDVMCDTLKKVEETFAAQAKTRRLFPGDEFEPCHECKAIAIKLKMEV